MNSCDSNDAVEMNSCDSNDAVKMNPWNTTVPPSTESKFFNDGGASDPIAILLVEGDSDRRFWAAWVDQRKCDIRAMGGRTKVLDGLQDAMRRGLNGFVAVIDADFDRLDGKACPLPNVVQTDCHDLEVTLLSSSALKKVLDEIASPAKLEACGIDVLEALFERGARLAQLRRLSQKEGLGLKFRKMKAGGELRYIDYAKFCHRTSWKLDCLKMIQEVINFSEQPGVVAAELHPRLEEFHSADLHQLCVGHDLVGLLSVGLRGKLGTYSSGEMNMPELDRLLRLAFAPGDLEATEMYRAIRRWEATNSPYRVLRVIS